MKNILKFITLLSVILFIAISCNYEDSNYDSLFTKVNSAATYYVQFNNNFLNDQVGRDENGDPINVESTILVELMGIPQSEDITATVSPDPASTMTADMYTLSTTSVTIPAGETSASIVFTTVGKNMPECESVKLILDLDVGDHTTPSDKGAKVNYTIRRISPSPLVNGFADLAGNWGVVKSYTNGTYFTEADFKTTWDGTNLIASGLGGEMIVNFWGENIVDGGTCNMTVTADGTITIPRQYIFTTDWDGDNVYDIEGSGTWVSLCGEAPVIKLNYDIIYAGTNFGLAASYSGYMGSSTLGGEFVLK